MLRWILFCGMIGVVFMGCTQPQTVPSPPVINAESASSHANATTVVLLENKRDKNAIVVSTNRESVVVDTPNRFVTMKDKDTKPSDPEMMDEDTIHALFGEALDALPQGTRKFVIYFDRNSAALTPQSVTELHTIAEAIREREPCDVALIGYTDTKGSVPYNRELSRQRVENTMSWIQTQPLKLRRVSKKYQGEEALEVETADEILEPKNRRVEIFIR